MSVQVVPLDCGWLRAGANAFEEGATRDPLDIPVPAWLVRHPSGDVVFDTGLHPDLANSAERLGWLAKVFEPTLTVDGTLGPRLERHGVDAAAVATVVVSHLHFDHVGGLRALPNARIVVQAEEWRHGADPDLAAANTYNQDDYLLGHDVHIVQGEHDLFGDGSVVCIPTAGHTAGHQSLRVRTAGGPVVLTADACYFAHTLDTGVLPPFAFDADEQRRSLGRLRDERARGARIVPGHDPDVFRALLRAQ